MRRKVRLITLTTAALSIAAVLPTPAVVHADGLSFATRYVDTSLAGGEPAVIYSSAANDLIYAAHEGTTLLYRSGYTEPSTTCDHFTAPSGFVCNYDNQINIWYSVDGGSSWTKSPSNPQHAGFSDPDLTQDAGGNIYATGIDLVNDALYSSHDGGRTWPTGTTECSPGDRQWVAGGPVPGVAWLSTNTEAGGHVVYETTNAGASCMVPGISDGGVGPSGSVGGPYTPYGKLLYLPGTDTLAEPVQFPDGGIGFSTLAHPMQAFAAGSGTWVGHEGVSGSATSRSSINVIAADTAGTIYMVWTTDTGSANSVMLVYTSDLGAHWSQPVTIAHPGTTVYWPWVTAGAPGNISIVWYQGDKVTDPSTDGGTDGVGGGLGTNWTIHDANVYGATGASPVIDSVNTITDFDGHHPGGVMHTGSMCSGTDCPLLGYDRRLGDYFTNNLDGNGCVVIASGDTQLVDPTDGGPQAVSHPLFIHQASGPSLTTGLDCAQFAAAVPEAAAPPLLVLPAALGALAVAVPGWRRRRRSLRSREA